MKYLLDTNVCIQFLNQRSERLVSRLRQIREGEVGLCSIVKAELWYGALKSGRPGENCSRLRFFFGGLPSVSFDDSAAEAYGNIRSSLEWKGTPIGPNDLCIAAIALARDLVLVTYNLREFQRNNGLTAEIWE